MAERSWRGWRNCTFKCGVDNAANVMLRLARADMRFVSHVSYQPRDGFVRYEIDLAALDDKSDGQCAELVVARALHDVVSLHTVGGEAA